MNTKILAINLVLLFIYCTLIVVETQGPERELGVLILTAMFLVLHVGANSVISVLYFIRKRPDLGKTYLLSALLVGLIGFGTCFLSVSV
jgi:hypothetical protein